MTWKLPTSLEVGGVGFSIRTDFRDILTILEAYNDPDLDDDAKSYVMLKILYEDYTPDENVDEAIRKGVEFIDAGHEDKTGRPQPRVMDWEQDAPIIASAINKVAGCEVRSLPYLHWWTFLGYYMEIGEGIFSQVVNIRNKKAKGKKLEEWEREFERNNKELVHLRTRISEEEQAVLDAEREALRELFGE